MKPDLPLLALLHIVQKEISQETKLPNHLLVDQPISLILINVTVANPKALSLYLPLLSPRCRHKHRVSFDEHLQGIQDLGIVQDAWQQYASLVLQEIVDKLETTRTTRVCIS